MATTGSPKRAVYSLTGSASSPFHAEPAQTPQRRIAGRAARRGQVNQNSTSDAGMKRRPRFSAASGAKSIPPRCYHRAEPAGCCTVDLWTKDSLSGTSVRLPEPSCTQRHRSPTREHTSRSRPLATLAARMPAVAHLLCSPGRSVRSSPAPRGAPKRRKNNLSPRSSMFAPRRTKRTAGS